MFLQNVFYTFSTNLVSVGVNFLVGILLARALTVTDRGIMVLVMTLPWTVVSLISFGLPQAMVYQIGRKKRDASLVLGNALVNALAISLIAVVALSIWKQQLLSSVLSGLPEELWLPLMLLIPVLLMDVMLLSILRARQRFDLFNLKRLITPLLTLIGFIAILVTAGEQLRVATYAYVVVMCLLTVLTVLVTRSEVRIRPAWDRQLTTRSFSFGFRSYAESLVGNLNNRLDIYLLAFFLTPEQVAFYGVAMSVAEAAWQIPDSVGLVLFPRLSNSPLENVHQITAQVCRTAMLIMGVAVAGLFAMSWFIIPFFYGSAYQATVLPLQLLLPGVLFMGLFKVLSRNFTSRDRQQMSILAVSAALVVNFGLDWMLIPSLGIQGAAIASTAGYVVAGMVLLRLFLHESGLPWQDVILPRWSELVGHWRWFLETLHGWRPRVRERAE